MWYFLLVYGCEVFLFENYLGGALLCVCILIANIIYCLVFITNLIILVLAFDPKHDVIYPEVILLGYTGNVLAWMLMFGYSEMARKLLKMTFQPATKIERLL